MRKTLRRFIGSAQCEIRIDRDFARVIGQCASQPRAGSGGGTWIVPDMQRAYCLLHRAGLAHSIETWIDGELAGGLYGVAIGRMFYGESMFTRVRDASKIAVAHLVTHVAALGFPMIDCQMATSHLASLGAREIPRAEFSKRIAELVNSGPEPQRWHALAAVPEATP